MTLRLLIVNPESADGATQENWPKIASDLRTHFGPFSVAFTKAIGHGRKLANEAAKQGTKLIIACGGAGTISEGAKGIIESNEQGAPGNLPGGTGRGFCRPPNTPTHNAEAGRAPPHGRTRGNR